LPSLLSVSCGKAVRSLVVRRLVSKRYGQRRKKQAPPFLFEVRTFLDVCFVVIARNPVPKAFGIRDNEAIFNPLIYSKSEIVFHLCESA